METGATTQLALGASEPPPVVSDVLRSEVTHCTSINTNHVAGTVSATRLSASAPCLTADLKTLDTEAVVYLNEQQCTKVMKTLKAQCEVKQHCDTTLVVNNRKFYAHQCVLAANSAYFQSLFRNPGPGAGSGSTVHAEVIIPSSNVKAVESLLDYMYTGQLSVSIAIAEELMILSEKLAIGDIHQCCNIHLEKHIDISNWLLMLALGERYNMEDVVKSVEKCIVENFFVISQGEEVLAFSHGRLKQILRDCNPSGDGDLEHEILLVICKWVACHYLERCEHLTDLLTIVDKNKLDLKKVQALLQNHALQKCGMTQLPDTQHFIQEVALLQERRTMEEAERKRLEKELWEVDKKQELEKLGEEGRRKTEVEEKAPEGDTNKWAANVENSLRADENAQQDPLVMTKSGGAVETSCNVVDEKETKKDRTVEGLRDRSPRDRWSVKRQ